MLPSPRSGGQDAGFLGVDIGTSGVKALLLRPGGEVVATTTVALTIDTPHPGWAEQDPAAWWRAAGHAVRTLRSEHPGVAVAAVGISGQMHSSVFLDTQGEVIRPALLWCDGRTTAECREITDRAGGEPRLRDLVGNPAIEGFTLPKVLWLRRHEPSAFARLSKVLLAKDYVRFRLTGVLATEPSDASGTLLFDVARRRWSEAMFDVVDLPPSLMPDLGESAQVLGHVTDAAATFTGLADG
ncbi:MAG: FGGY family carbohydrate kinase [Gemmatimonadaceae bacterium]